MSILISMLIKYMVFAVEQFVWDQDLPNKEGGDITKDNELFFIIYWTLYWTLTPIGHGIFAF